MFSPLQRTKSAENVRSTRELTERRPKTVSDLLIQIEGEGIRTKRKPKIEIRNYARENVLRLREIQRTCRETKGTRNVPVKPEYKPNQFRKIPPNPSFCCSKTTCWPSQNHDQLNTSEIKTNTNAEKRKPQNISSASAITRKNAALALSKQASPSVRRQLSNESADKHNLACGVKNGQHSENKKSGAQDPVSIPQLPLHKPEELKLEASGLLNKPETSLKPSIIERTAVLRPQLRRSSSLSCILPPKKENLTTNLELPKKYQLGVVPKYLHVRQKQWREDEEKRKRETPDPSIPPGLELLPDADRLHTLTQLDESYNELLKQMLMLPVRMDTLRIRQQKENIEKEMVRIEEAIKIFSQPKVFIKKDE